MSAVDVLAVMDACAASLADGTEIGRENSTEVAEARAAVAELMEECERIRNVSPAMSAALARCKGEAQP